MNGATQPPDLRSLIDSRACVRRVEPATHGRIVLDVETTKDEIVDVTGGADPMSACLIETAWAVRLDAAQASSLRAHYTVELGG